MDPEPSARRRFLAAWAGGAAVAAIAFFWMVTEATGNLLRYQRLNSDFYEAQADALLSGRLAIPARVLGLEAFSHDGSTYTYFPPFPALLRLPFVAVTDALDGRLATMFTFVAFLVALTGCGFLAWRIRSIVRGDQPLGRGETVGVAGLAVLVGIGSPLFFPSSRPWVYHEAAVWGMALAVCAYDQVLAFVRRPTRANLTRAALFGAGALLSRPPIGAGVFATLALVLLVAGLTRWRPTWGALRHRTGMSDALTGTAWLGGLALAIAVPAAIYVAINLAKFGTPLSVPYDAQLQNLLDPNRRKVLAANDGSLFTLAALPTQLLQLVRPDALRIHSTFPFVGFPTARPRIVGSLLFDQRDYTVSLTAAAPALVGLAVVGAVRTFRRGAECLRLPVVGATIVLPVSLSILYVAQRYASDLLPLLLLLGFTGFWTATGWLTHRRRGVRGALVAAFSVVVAVGAWSGVALALEYQRNLTALVPDDLRRQYVGWQWDVADTLGFGRPDVRYVDDALPAPGPRDTLAVLGDCRAVYVSNGDEWLAAERTADAGHYRLAVRFPDAEPGTREALLTVGDGPGRWTIVTHTLADGDARLEIAGRPEAGPRFSAPAGSESVLDVVMDPVLGELRVLRDGRVLLGAGYTGTGSTLTVGDDPAGSEAPFTGRVRTLPVRPTLCRSLPAPE